MLHRIFQAERKKERKAQRGREQTNKLAEPALFMYAMNQNVHFWNEIKNAAIVIMLIVAYLLLMVPYIIRVKVDQIIQVKWAHNIDSCFAVQNFFLHSPISRCRTRQFGRFAGQGGALVNNVKSP